MAISQNKTIPLITLMTLIGKWGSDSAGRSGKFLHFFLDFCETSRYHPRRKKGKSRQLARPGKTIPLMTQMTQIGRKQLAISQKLATIQLKKPAEIVPEKPSAELISDPQPVLEVSRRGRQ